MNDEHVYSKWNKTGCANSRGWLVNGIPFYTLYEAEEYCMAHALDPDNAILHEPNEAKEISDIAMRELRFLRDKLTEMHEKQRHIVEGFRRQSQESDDRDLVARARSAIAREYMLEATGEASGLLTVMQLITDRMLGLNNVVSAHE